MINLSEWRQERNTIASDCHAKAQDCYERARQGWPKQTHLSTEIVKELKSFQAEAEALLQESKP